MLEHCGDNGHFSPVISVKHTCSLLQDTGHLASAQARGPWQHKPLERGHISDASGSKRTIDGNCASARHQHTSLAQGQAAAVINRCGDGIVAALYLGLRFGSFTGPGPATNRSAARSRPRAPSCSYSSPSARCVANPCKETELERPVNGYTKTACARVPTYIYICTEERYKSAQ